ncbi:MAG: pitrilysin family protein [Candidatus Dojkabacteria bacterium]|nr:MAG: pitrilysin family protein [Candidatus Dojkabacteria bacterium]
MRYRHETLKNGLRVLAIGTPQFKSINVQVKLHGGPSLETKKNNGISHFVEHMVLEGGKLHPDKNKFDEEIELLGGDYNGYTSHYSVGFTISVPDTHLHYAVEYMYDVCFQPTFPEERLEKERTAILDEIHNYESRPNRKYSDFYRKTRYLNNSAPLPIVGKASHVSKMSRTALMEWHKKLFVPDNMTICIVGNIDPDEAVRYVEEAFGVEKASGLDFQKETATSELSGRSIKTQVDTNETKSIGAITLPSLELRLDNFKERLTLSMIAAIFANYRSSVLFKKLRKETGMIYSIGGSFSSALNEPGYFDIDFTTSDDKIITVYEMVFEEIKRLLRDGFTERELQIGIEGSINSLKMGCSSISDFTDWYMPGIFWFNRFMTIEEEIKMKESITLDETNALFRETFKWDRVNIISRVNSPSVRTKLNRKLEEVVR